MVDVVIVVARYNENIEWVHIFEQQCGYNVIIYNKGEPLNLNNEILLENVGREPHTYYTYITSNYNNLPEYIIFLQGNPFDHSPNLFENIKKIQFIDFEFLSERIITNKIDAECSEYWQCKNIKETYKKIFNKECDTNQECHFGAGAQFIVSKKGILSNSKEFYENIVHITAYSVCPMEAYDIERFHEDIFKVLK